VVEPRIGAAAWNERAWMRQYRDGGCRCRRLLPVVEPPGRGSAKRLSPSTRDAVSMARSFFRRRRDLIRRRRTAGQLP
jgi:hypothetical protein